MTPFCEPSPYMQRNLYGLPSGILIPLPLGSRSSYMHLNYLFFALLLSKSQLRINEKEMVMAQFMTDSVTFWTSWFLHHLCDSVPGSCLFPVPAQWPASSFLLSLSSGMLFCLCLHCSRVASFVSSVHFKKKLSLIPHPALKVLGRAEGGAPGRGQSGMALHFLAPRSTCQRLCQCPQDLEVFWILFS